MIVVVILVKLQQSHNEHTPNLIPACSKLEVNNRSEELTDGLRIPVRQVRVPHSDLSPYVVGVRVCSCLTEVRACFSIWKKKRQESTQSLAEWMGESFDGTLIISKLSRGPRQKICEGQRSSAPWVLAGKPLCVHRVTFTSASCSACEFPPASLQPFIPEEQTLSSDTVTLRKATVLFLAWLANVQCGWHVVTCTEDTSFVVAIGDTKASTAWRFSHCRQMSLHSTWYQTQSRHPTELSPPLRIRSQLWDLTGGRTSTLPFTGTSPRVRGTSLKGVWAAACERMVNQSDCQEGVFNVPAASGRRHVTCSCSCHGKRTAPILLSARCVHHGHFLNSRFTHSERIIIMVLQDIAPPWSQNTGKFLLVL